MGSNLFGKFDTADATHDFVFIVASAGGQADMGSATPRLATVFPETVLMTFHAHRGGV